MTYIPNTFYQIFCFKALFKANFTNTFFGKIIPTYFYYAEKWLVYIIIIILFSY